MAIVFNCPHCGELHRVKDELAGRVGKCKRADCRQQILIPLKSTVPANGPATADPMDAEALAAAAFSEEAPPAPATDDKAAAAPAKMMKVACTGCDAKFEVDQAMQGKNTRCPECGHVFRVPKIIEDKPADWREAGKRRPSMAKAEDAPEGAWTDERRGVSADSIRKAGAHEVEEEEDPRDRRMRRIKTTLYGLALIGVVGFAVLYIIKSRREGKQEQWMEKALQETDRKDKFRAGVERYAGEFYVRNVSKNKREELDAALKHLKEESRDKLLQLPQREVDRNAMLIEVAQAFVVCGGDFNEVNEDRRLSWDKVHPEIRKSLGGIPADEWELRVRGLRLTARRLAAKDQGQLAAEIAKHSCTEAELPEMLGKIGIEFVQMGKKEAAEKLLAKAPARAAPALTALWLALHPDQDRPPASFPHVAPPAKGAALPRENRAQRLAYAEGRALQGRVADALAIAEAPGDPTDRAEALVLVAAAAADGGKAEEAGPVLDAVAALYKPGSKAGDEPVKAPPQASWVMVRAVEAAAKVNKTDAAQTILEAIKDEGVRSWARLEILRARLAAQPKQKADETWVETVSDPTRATLAAAIARAEVARHNAAAGESSYTRTVEAMGKGVLRAFGYAGTALGNQDRTMK
jgi:DNA-directed RNA polymerase subunit RPC12/RpoP